MQLGRSGVFATVVGILISVAFLLSACGGSPSTTGQSARTSTSTRSEPSTTLSANATAVLAAYRAGWTAYDKALVTANAYDSALPITMTQPLLQKVEVGLLDDAARGIVGRGPIELRPQVTSLTATTATVVDCAYSSSMYFYAKSGKPVPPITKPEHDEVTATLVLQDGTWMVSQQSVSDGKCSGTS